MSTETNTKKNEWREREVGALWMKQGTTQDFMSGHCSVNDEKVELVVFKNKNKTSSQKSATQSNGGATSSDPEEVPELLA